MSDPVVPHIITDGDIVMTNADEELFHLYIRMLNELGIAREFFDCITWEGDNPGYPLDPKVHDILLRWRKVRTMAAPPETWCGL